MIDKGTPHIHHANIVGSGEPAAPSASEVWPQYPETNEVSVVQNNSVAEVPVMVEQGEVLSRSEKLARGVGYAAIFMLFASGAAVGYGINESHRVPDGIGTQFMAIGNGIGVLSASLIRLIKYKRNPKPKDLK